MPKLWSETIQTHRQAVRDAALDATAALVAGHGLRAVTMSRIAADTGIGRATLYKYFPDVEAILLAWHERQVHGHLEGLAELRAQAAEPGAAVETVLEAYAFSQHGQHAGDLAALLHRGEHMARAHQRLAGFIEELLRDAAQTGEIRRDVAPRELASYCLHALGAARQLPSRAAVRRLVRVTLAGLR